MTSPYGKDKFVPKSIDCYVQEKCSMTSQKRHDLANIITEINQLDEIDFQRISTPTSSSYSDARNSVSALSSRNGCTGDSHALLPETSPKSEKDILVLDGNIMKQIYAKQKFSTSKTIHVDLAPEDECCKNNDITSGNDAPKSSEFHGARNKVFTEKYSNGETVKHDSNRDFQGTLPKAGANPKMTRCNKHTYDGERRVRWSPEAFKLDYFGKNLEEIRSIESLNQSAMKEDYIPTYNMRENVSPEISPRFERNFRSHAPKQTTESFAQTDQLSEKTKKKSKFKTTLAEFFLSFAKCFM